MGNISTSVQILPTHDETIEKIESPSSTLNPINDAIKISSDTVSNQYIGNNNGSLINEVQVASSLPFPKHGIKMSSLPSFIEFCGGRDNLLGCTTTDVCEKFVKPATKAIQGSFCDLLATQDHNAVGIATTFISHAWKYDFLDVVDALQYHFTSSGELDETSEQDVIIFFDLFSNNQHAAIDLDFDWWSTTFKSAIAQLGRTVVVFAPWNNPLPLTRGWCLFELYCTIEAKSRLEVAMGRRHREAFIDAVIADASGEIDRMLAVVNVEKSECGKKEDEDRIKDVVRSTVGFRAVNAMVFEKLREWVIATTFAVLESERDDVEKQLSLQSAIGDLYRGQGKYKEAKNHYVEVLEKRKELLGAVHPATLASVHNLGLLLYYQAKYDDAKTLYLEVLAKREEVLGRDHPDTLSSIHKLANLCCKQGRYDEAEVLYLEELQKRRIILGEDHPDTLCSIHKLANLYSKQCRYEEAKTLYLEELQKRREILGPNHPDTLSSMHKLANLYSKLGLYQEAEALYLEDLEKRKVELGCDHPDTLSSMYKLANLYCKQSLCDEAHALLVDVLVRRQKMLGPNHPDTLSTMTSIAGLYHDLGRFDEAQALLEVAVDKYTHVLGVDHPDTKDAVQLRQKIYSTMNGH